MNMATSNRERIYRGIPVSHGFALGRAYLHRSGLPETEERILEPSAVPTEVRRFRGAVGAARQDLDNLHAQVKREMGRDFAEFIGVQLALLQDEELLTETERFVRERCRNAEFAYAETLRNLARPIAGSGVALFRERALDVVDVGARVLRKLLGDELPSLHSLSEGSIVVAHDLPPSEAALLDPGKVCGLVLEGGGKTSHTAIMAKAKEIPAVFGTDAVARGAENGQRMVVDGYRGLAILDPTPQRLRVYESDIARYEQYRRSLSRLADEEPVTCDGKVIDLSANIEFVMEAKAGMKYGARGVGLFRTEYSYLARAQPPTEEEQFQTIAEVARMMSPMPVIVRTFDLGGDKVIPGYSESNPFLGWRGLRLCFDNQELFKGQLRAILRASAVGNVKVMFPMLSTVEELRRALILLEESKEELKESGADYDDGMEVGVMVETPSAALMADHLAKSCSFLSIGSNDLTQYTLAVDRGNERVAGLYDHFHPAVLQLIRTTVDAAHRQGIWVGLCGEFASDPLGIMVLLGMGIDELSVIPSSIPEAKNIIRAIDTSTAAEVVGRALELATAVEVRRLLHRELHQQFPKLAEFMFQFEDDEGMADEGQ